MAALEPLPPGQWDRVKLAHLLNRTGFGATPGEVDAWSNLTCAQAVDRLVDWESTPDPLVPPAWINDVDSLLEKREEYRRLPEAERREKVKEVQKELRRNLEDLRTWWLEAMWRTPRPLQEKLALFWHGHFATSAEKVKQPWFMWKQNQLFRENANGNFRKLLVEVARDPAMLIWLDGRQNKAGAPNENFARELMELFTLGEGHYTEKDIQESARAFTGWVAGGPKRKDSFLIRMRHDNGTKTFMGQSGNFADTDIIDIILQQPQAARFMARKIWTFFAYENPEPEALDALSETFRKSNYELKPLLKQMLLSREFYSEKSMHTQVKSPVVWMIGTFKNLEVSKMPRLLPSMTLRLMGQDLFAPPSVKGWDGGRTWISTNTLLLRNNLASAMVYGGSLQNLRPNAGNNAEQPKAGEGEMMAEAQPAKAKFSTPPLARFEMVLPPEQRGAAPEMLQKLADRFYSEPLHPKELAAFQKDLPVHAKPSDRDLQPVIYAMLSSIRYQLN